MTVVARLLKRHKTRGQRPWRCARRSSLVVSSQLAGPNWEIYGHWQNEWNKDPSQIRTDVYYLLTS
jgi:hypothetical protein